MSTTEQQMNLRIGRGADLIKRHRNEAYLSAKGSLVAVLLRGPAYPDEIIFSDLTATCPCAIGIAVRNLVRVGLIEKTGNYRASRKLESNGRIIWEYRMNPAP